ncbi:MAG: glycoside hydrolase family 11 protein [candidate division WOR-3 bacterium]
MSLRRLLIIFGTIVLAAIVFIWGCQNHPTAPESKIDAGTKVRGYSSGSCSGTFKVTFQNAVFTAGQGWSSGASRTISWSGSCSGCSWGLGVYGWLQNPLVEYYIGKSGGSSKGSYSCNGRSYTLQITTRNNAPSIEGTKTFQQYNCSGSTASPVDMGCHFNAWRNLGASVGSQNYQIVLAEGWSGNTGSATMTVSGANWYSVWSESGSVSYSCGSSGSTTTTTTSGSTTTTTTSGTTTTTSGGSKTIVVRARGTSGSEQIQLTVGGSTVATWTLSTSMSNYTATTTRSGGTNVCFTNDGSGRDVQVDYIQVNGSTRQSENQSYNTGCWDSSNNKCGKSYCEWLHCNGCIGYGDI